MIKIVDPSDYVRDEPFVQLIKRATTEKQALSFNDVGTYIGNMAPEHKTALIGAGLGGAYGLATARPGHTLEDMAYGTGIGGIGGYGAGALASHLAPGWLGTTKKPHNFHRSDYTPEETSALETTDQAASGDRATAGATAREEAVPPSPGETAPIRPGHTLEDLSRSRINPGASETAPIRPERTPEVTHYDQHDSTDRQAMAKAREAQQIRKDLRNKAYEAQNNQDEQDEQDAHAAKAHRTGIAIGATSGALLGYNQATHSGMLSHERNLANRQDESTAAYFRRLGGPAAYYPLAVYRKPVFSSDGKELAPGGIYTGNGAGAGKFAQGHVPLLPSRGPLADAFGHHNARMRATTPAARLRIRGGGVLGGLAGGLVMGTVADQAFRVAKRIDKATR